MSLITQAVLAFSFGAALIGADTGYAVRYAPGRMERTATIRQIARQPCMVAWTQAKDADIGKTWLIVEGPAGRRRCLVVDLPQARDKPGLVRRRVAIELDFDSSRIVCGARWTGRAVECPITWFVASVAIASTTTRSGGYAALTYPTPPLSIRIAKQATAPATWTKRAAKSIR